MADMDLGSLFITLKVHNNEALKAIKQYEDNIKKTAEESKKIGAAIRQSFSAINTSFGMAVGSIRKGAQVITSSFGLIYKSIDVLFTPLKYLVAGFTLVDGMLKAVGASCIVTAGKFEYLYKKLQITLGQTRVAQVWKESMQTAGFFDVEQIMEASSLLESVGVKGAKALETISDAAIMLDLDIQEVARSIMRMSAGTLRGVRLMGIDFEIVGKTYWFRYWKEGNEYAEKAVGVAAAQTKIIEILASKFGGATKNVNKTFTGLWNTLHTTIQEMRGEIGSSLLPIVDTFLERIISSLKGSMSFGKSLGESLRDNFVKAASVIEASFSTAWEVIKQMENVIKQEGGLGKIIQEAFAYGVKIFVDGFLVAIKSSVSIWKFIANVFSNAVLEALAKSGIPGLKGLGTFKHSRDIQAGLADLSRKDMLKIANAYGIDLYDTTIDKAFGTVGIPNGAHGVGAPFMPVPVAGLSAFNEYPMIEDSTGVLIPKYEKSTEKLKKEIADRIKGLSEDEIKTEFEGMSKIINKELAYDPYGGINKGIEEIRTNLSEGKKELVESIAKNTQEFIDGLTEGATSDKINIKELFKNKLQNIIKSYQEAIQKYDEQQKQIQEEQNKPIPNQPRKTRIYNLDELATEAFPDAPIQTIVAQYREAQRNLNMLYMTEHEKEKIIELDRFRKLLQDEYLGGTREEAQKALEYLETLSKIESGHEKEIEDLKTKILQYDTLNSQIEAYLDKILQAQEDLEDFTSLAEFFNGIQEEMMTPAEKLQNDLMNIEAFYEKIYGKDWKLNEDLAKEYEDITKFLTEKIIGKQREEQGGAGTYDPRYVNINQLGGKIEEAQLSVLRSIEKKIGPTY